MRLGNLSLTLFSDGIIKHDGGILFGHLAKSSWEQVARPDRRNRVPLEMASLLIQSPKHTILVDTGAGSKGGAQREPYGLGPSRLLRQLRAAGVGPRDVDIVILTHLHFDRSGGASRLNRWGEVVPTFPRATYLVQHAGWEEATAPTERCVSSYDADDFLCLEQHGQVSWLDGNCEVVPGVWAKVTGAHTQGHQIILVDEGGERVAFLSDLVPTHHHLPLSHIAASDRFPEQTLEQKRQYLHQAEKEGWLAIFGHGFQGIHAGYLVRRDGQLQVRPVDMGVGS